MLLGRCSEFPSRSSVSSGASSYSCGAMRSYWCGREKCQFACIWAAYEKGEGDSGALKPKGNFLLSPHLVCVALK